MQMRSLALLIGLWAAGGVAATADSKAVWKAKCEKCHGADGQARTQVGKREQIDDFSAPRWQKRHSDAFIRETIAHGSKENRKMKGYAGQLTSEQIESLIAYIRSFGGRVDK